MVTGKSRAARTTRSSAPKWASGLYKRETPGLPDKIEALVEEAKDSVEGRIW